MSESTLLTLPVVCTRGMIVFPGNRLSLDVGRPLSLKALELSSRDFDNNILFVSQINPIVDDRSFCLTVTEISCFFNLFGYFIFFL